MKFPYGICDFEKIISNNYFYVDRTHKIPLLEDAGDYLLFLRPRRFGKSLLLSMLENYYDVAKADEFDQLFGHLAIAQNPTPKHNQYFVMNWDFSGIDSSGTPEEIQQRMHDHVNGSIEQFIAHYESFLDYDIFVDPNNAARSLQSVFAAVKRTPYKLYLLIDEYDNFANEVMMAGLSATSQERYEALIYEEGALKALFKTVKYGTKGLGIDRILITGVSPVVMSDISSGFNIAENIYLQPDFNDLCGFWEAEILAALQKIAKKCGFTKAQVKEMMAMMRAFYNGYSFSYHEKPLIYNSTNSLYFLKHLQKNCQVPRQILDDNLAMDRNKIVYISQLPHGKQVITNALNEQEPLTLDQLASRFGVDEIVKATKDTPFMLSLLYYFGVLTLSGEISLNGELILKIPNLVIRKLYAERIKELLLPEFTLKEEAQRLVKQFYQTGKLQPLCQFIERTYFKVFDNRDYRWTNELTIKTAFLTLLFNDIFYLMDSETALDRTYADLTMIIRPDMRQYQLLDFLMEFKYVSLKQVGLTGEEVKQKTDAQLKALDAVKAQLAESKEQVNRYRKTLLAYYDNKLRLQSYTVVAIGYERLLSWEW
ncbi:MAG: AAA family ATPase [Thiomargarita sp.]|nr:AAA family ATPase [Thiomargarita sp.]